MVRNNVDLYLDAVEKNLICGKKYRKVLMKQLAADIEDFSDEHSGELTMEEFELHFGTTGEVAELLLKQTDVPEIRKLVNQKKIVIACVIATCILVLASVIGYLWFDNERKEAFINGYEVETVVYDEWEIPDHVKNPPENTQVY